MRSWGGGGIPWRVEPNTHTCTQRQEKRGGDKGYLLINEPLAFVAMAAVSVLYRASCKNTISVYCFEIYSIV